jgi:hypothetical protein
MVGGRHPLTVKNSTLQELFGSTDESQISMANLTLPHHEGKVLTDKKIKSIRKKYHTIAAQDRVDAALDWAYPDFGQEPDASRLDIELPVKTSLDLYTKAMEPQLKKQKIKPGPKPKTNRHAGSMIQYLMPAAQKNSASPPTAPV